jgi:hypothetical protein
MTGKRILVSPLSWGLGHATRCIPVVRQILEYGGIPVLAGEGAGLRILREAFPQAEWHDLNADAAITYPAGRPGWLRFGWRLMRQSGAFKRSIAAEHSALQEIHRRAPLDAVISDNRFGMYLNGVPSIFITHQLSPMFPGMGRWLRRRNNGYIRNFTEVWVPDDPAPMSLSGALSVSPDCPVPEYHIGVLSRFQACAVSVDKQALVFLISGPEPQRSQFEAAARAFAEAPESEQFAAIVVVTGQPGEQVDEAHGRLRVVNHLPAEALQSVLCSARLVVSRSGYSSLMDYRKLGVRALIYPTPGQTEQEYLCRLLDGKFGFTSGRRPFASLADDIGRALQASDPLPARGAAAPDGRLMALAGLLS